MNKNYARLTGGKLQYAPSTLITPQGIIMNPKRLSYLQAGWKFLDLQAPAEAPEGKEYVISGYTETTTDIRAIYKLVPLNPPPITYSKLRLIAAFSKRNLWQQVRDWLIETDLYDLFLAAQDFRSDHPQFTAALSAAQSNFTLTPSETAAILEESEAKE